MSPEFTKTKSGAAADELFEASYDRYRQALEIKPEGRTTSLALTHSQEMKVPAGSILSLPTEAEHYLLETS